MLYYVQIVLNKLASVRREDLLCVPETEAFSATQSLTYLVSLTCISLAGEERREQAFSRLFEAKGTSFKRREIRKSDTLTSGEKS